VYLESNMTFWLLEIVAVSVCGKNGATGTPATFDTPDSERFTASFSHL